MFALLCSTRCPYQHRQMRRSEQGCTSLILSKISQGEAQTLRIPIRLLALLRESLQQNLPGNSIADVPDVASSDLIHESSPQLDMLANSLPGATPLPRSTRRTKAAAKAALQSAAEQQPVQASELQLKGSRRSARVLDRGIAQQAPLNGFHKPAESTFHGPMKPLRPPGDEQHASAAHLNGAHRRPQLEPEQASRAPEGHGESVDSQAQSLQVQAPDAAGAEAAVGQEAAAEATCTEALSIALSGRPPSLTYRLRAIS